MSGMSLESLLGEVAEVDGVRGCALTTSDGMAVRSDLRGRFREDVVSGLASFLVSTTRRAFEEAGQEGIVDRFVVHATHGKLVLKKVHDAFLVVITDQFARLEPLLEAVDEIAARMGAASRMDG
jgi:predicted regulator of Ras-like GTPase activity (Roadblock/LC7/MglB family)